MPHIASREEEFSVERICIARKGGGEGGNHTKEVVSGGEASKPNKVLSGNHFACQHKH